MHICLGVCGIGKGHSSRQLQLATELKACGHELTVLGYGEAIDVFRANGFPIREIWHPYTGEGKGWAQIKHMVKYNYSRAVPGLVRDISVLFKLAKGNYPDLFVSDYEPVSARFAYLRNKPLILFNQHGKFRHWPFAPIDSFNAEGEKNRLELFFPKFTKSFVVSLFPLPKHTDERIDVVPPPIPSELRSGETTTTNNIVVYFSQHPDRNTAQSLEEMCGIFSSEPKYNFIVYTKQNIDDKRYGNVRFKKPSRTEFIQDLKSCGGAISTAGFTLISEILFLGKPIFCIPLPNFDQVYCSKYIAEQGFGSTDRMLTENNLRMFLENLGSYRNNMKNVRNFFDQKDPIKTVVGYIEGIKHDSRLPRYNLARSP